MANQIPLADIVVDCADEKRLCQFYAEFLGWQKCELFGHPAILSENGVMFLFVQDEGYVPCVWPEQEGKQQKQMHFDFHVPNVPAAVARAEELGARKAESQFGGPHFTTMSDPEGHPFCLCAKE